MAGAQQSTSGDERTEVGRPDTRRQLASFGVTGILNTAADFAILNICIFVIGLPVIFSNIISVTISLALSFTLNNRWVFSGHSVSRFRRVVLFLVVTLLGLYGFQTIIIHFFTTEFLLPAQAVMYVSNALGLNLSAEFIIANTAKIIATMVTMVWNFVMYKKFVFKR
jgi:putative flippase GtrA